MFELSPLFDTEFSVFHPMVARMLDCFPTYRDINDLSHVKIQMKTLAHRWSCMGSSNFSVQDINGRSLFKKKTSIICTSGYKFETVALSEHYQEKDFQEIVTFHLRPSEMMSFLFIDGHFRRFRYYPPHQLPFGEIYAKDDIKFTNPNELLRASHVDWTDAQKRKLLRHI